MAHSKKQKKSQAAKSSVHKPDLKPFDSLSTAAKPAQPIIPSPRQLAKTPIAQKIATTKLPTAERVNRIKGIYWIAGIGVYAVTSYGVYLYIQYSKALKIHQEDERQYKLGLKFRPDVNTNEVYEKISKDYDSSVRLSEFCMGVPLLRRWLLWDLKGDVLEASAGTGRNNKYYPLKKCKSITMVDNSPSMLEEAKHDFENRYPKYGKITFAAQDASQPISSPSGEGFDRVVQTMGLCSQDSPVRTLQNLERHCKPGGKILLLEHGRSHYTWLNNILDAFVIDHAKTWGCFWNRDIGKVLEESGLAVNKISRFHLGTTWLIEASPRQHERDEAELGSGR